MKVFLPLVSRVFSRFSLPLLAVFLLQTLPFFSLAQSQYPNRPRLIVGIVVDQMRYDFLYRYYTKYGNNGFKRLLREGFSFENAQYNYVPTYTGPGHASIYTGTTPAWHGIVGNNWFNRRTGKDVYCTDDPSVKTVGSNSVFGQMSPANLYTSTITDELRLATNMGAKTIGVCLKDRGSILPAGHLANAAYWYDGTIGGWITSTFYTEKLPAWVQAFNEKQTAGKYLSQPWNPLLPLAQYTESTPDDNEFEVPFKGVERPVFPHNLPVLRGTTFDLLRSTPFGNSYTKDFAIETIKQEKLGKGAFTDFLALSFSSTDYIGHQFGPNSVEIEDTYLRLDQDLAELLTFLDKEFGKKNVLVFLTADHGAAHGTNFLSSTRMPAGSYGPVIIQDSVQRYLVSEYGPGQWVSAYVNQQIYLNHNLLAARKIPLKEAQEKTVAFLQRFPVLAKIVSASELRASQWNSGLLGLMQNGFNPGRSGDVLVSYQPGWLEGYSGPLLKGTTHGSAARYDTHVPLLFYGWNVKPGQNSEEVHIPDIAATLAQWLKIQEPNGCSGKPLQGMMK